MLRVLAVTLCSVLAIVLLLIVADAMHQPSCDADVEPGTVISIPGETMTVMESQRNDTLVLDVLREPFEWPDYSLVPEHGHIHPNQSEHFLIVEGRAQVLVGDEIHTLGPGDSINVPPNTVHHWMALDDQDVRVIASFAPALRVAEWFVHFQGHIANNTMDLIQAAVISREFGGSSPTPVEPPAWLWNSLSRVLAPLGRMLGYRAC